MHVWWVLGIEPKASQVLNWPCITELRLSIWVIPETDIDKNVWVIKQSLHLIDN